MKEQASLICLKLKLWLSFLWNIYLCVRNLLLKAWMQGENNHKSTSELLPVGNDHSYCFWRFTRQTWTLKNSGQHLKNSWTLWKKQATHKPSLKAAFFLSAGLTDGPYITPQADTKTGFVITRLHGSKKDSRSEGCLLRKARLFPRTLQVARKYSWKYKTWTEIGTETQGNTWLVWVSNDWLSQEKACDTTQIQRIKLNRKWCRLLGVGKKKGRAKAISSQMWLKSHQVVHFKLNRKILMKGTSRNNFKLAETC